MSGDNFDMVVRYGRAFGWEIDRRTVLVEGTTDVDLFRLAAGLEKEHTGEDLFVGGLTVIAAGEGSQGGAQAVARELHGLRCVARTIQRADGRPKYRFIGLFDNDSAGQRAIATARSVDRGILEYRDVFRLRPVMPRDGNVDPKALERTFRERNASVATLEWELEDLVSTDFAAAFLEEYPAAVARQTRMADRVHREYTRDGKARFHRYVRENAMRADVGGVIDVMKALRFYFGLQPTAKGFKKTVTRR